MLFLLNSIPRFLFLSRINGSSCNRKNYFSTSSILYKKYDNELFNRAQQLKKLKETVERGEIEIAAKNRGKVLYNMIKILEKMGIHTIEMKEILMNPHYHITKVGIPLNESDTKEVLNRIEELKKIKKMLKKKDFEQDHVRKQKKLDDITKSINKLNNILEEKYAHGQTVSKKKESDLLDRIRSLEQLKYMYESQIIIPSPKKPVNMEALTAYINMLKAMLPGGVPEGKETEKTGKESPKVIDKQPGEESPKVIDKKPAEEFPKVIDKEPGEEIPKVIDKEPGGEIPKVIDKQPAEEIPKITDKEHGGEIPKVIDKEPGEESPKVIDKEPGEESPKVIDKEPAKESPTVIDKELGDESPKVIDKDTGEESPQVIDKEPAKESPKVIDKEPEIVEQGEKSPKGLTSKYSVVNKVLAHIRSLENLIKIVRIMVIEHDPIKENAAKKDLTLLIKQVKADYLRKCSRRDCLYEISKRERREILFRIKELKWLKIDIESGVIKRYPVRKKAIVNMTRLMNMLKMKIGCEVSRGILILDEAEENELLESIKKLLDLKKVYEIGKIESDSIKQKEMIADLNSLIDKLLNKLSA